MLRRSIKIEWVVDAIELEVGTSEFGVDAIKCGVGEIEFGVGAIELTTDVIESEVGAIELAFPLIAFMLQTIALARAVMKHKREATLRGPRAIDVALPRSDFGRVDIALNAPAIALAGAVTAFDRRAIASVAAASYKPGRLSPRK
jgi:hypothetical protein